MTNTERCAECGGELRRFANGSLACPSCSFKLGIDTSSTQVAAMSAEPTTPAAAESGPDPTTVDRYQLLEPIGEGGMGTVYRALQTEPVRREVALKFVKWGMDTREVVTRFEAERQALALMDHPAIARVFDGGATPEGRPYFVMEYVRGAPITEYCDRERLTTRARVELVARVCDGVQHAHQKGVIHRDLKPSNVLVADQDGMPAPKVIDFGIAKAIGAGLTDRTLHTRLDQRVGTPEYMSPEQTEPGGVDVDTRTDVYSLGVILYELLTGSRPFTGREETAAGYDELLRRIREHEPPRPSTRARSSTRTTSELAERRRTDAARLRQELRGDLDWIVMKALEKNRERRYGSPAELAADLRRHLADQPVIAGPPRTSYRVRKFVRRHRFAVAAGSVIAVALLVAVAATSMGLLRARRAERVAAAEAAKATAINSFLQDVLGSADPYTRLGRDVTVLEALDEASGRIETVFRNQPEIRAALEETIGTTYLKLGRFDDAEPLLREALATRRELFPGDHDEVAASLASYGRLQRARNRLDDAEEMQREALAMRRRLHVEPSPEIADTLYDLAWIETDRGAFADGEALFAEALAMRRRLDPPQPLAVAEAIHGLAGARANAGDYEAASALYAEALAMRQAELGERHLLVAQSQSALGLTLQTQGRLDEAEPPLVAALETRRSLLGESHPDIVDSLNSLGALRMARGDPAAAQAVFEELLPMARGLWGDRHPTVARTLHNLGSVRREQGDLDGAETYYLEALELSRTGADIEPAPVGIVLYNLANVSLDRGRPVEAETRLREAVAILAASLPADHWRLATARSRLGESLTAQGRYTEAEPLLLEAWPPIRDTRGESSEAARDALRRIVDLYRAWGREDEAARWAGL